MSRCLKRLWSGLTKQTSLDTGPLSAGTVALLRAAERLFAEHGFNGVSLREITETAGHRNASAIQYHFGSRDGLIKAVFMHRMTAINPRRLAILDRLAREDGEKDVRALIGAWVWPLAEQLQAQKDECFYLRFLERFLRDRILIDKALTDRSWTTGWRKTARLLEEALSDLPSGLAKLRLQIAANQSVSGLANIEAMGRKTTNTAAMIEVLVDSIVAGLTQPPSQEAQEALASPRKKASPSIS